MGLRGVNHRWSLPLVYLPFYFYRYPHNTLVHNVGRIHKTRFSSWQTLQASQTISFIPSGISKKLFWMRWIDCRLTCLNLPDSTQLSLASNIQQYHLTLNLKSQQLILKRRFSYSSKGTRLIPVGITWKKKGRRSDLTYWFSVTPSGVLRAPLLGIPKRKPRCTSVQRFSFLEPPWS